MSGPYRSAVQPAPPRTPSRPFVPAPLLVAAGAVLGVAAKVTVALLATL